MSGISNVRWILDGLLIVVICLKVTIDYMKLRDACMKISMSCLERRNACLEMTIDYMKLVDACMKSRNACIKSIDS
jgi:hypothetical protein